jgi:hypothetical protein
MIETAPEEFDQDERLIDLLARSHDDPSFFNSVILNRMPFWWRQEEIARSVVEYRDTVVYTGNAVGKDYFVGSLIWWWLLTRYDSLVIVMAPSQALIGTVTWKEVRRASECCRFNLGAEVTFGAKSSPQKVTISQSGWSALGHSSATLERLSGQHNANLLLIVEEASGIEDEVSNAADALNYTKSVWIGNPTRSSGRFITMIRKADEYSRNGVAKHESINAIRIRSHDSPHANLVKSPVGLADKTWLDACRRMYGEGSLWWKSHVEAEIPNVVSEQLISDAWLEWSAAHERPRVRFGDQWVGTTRIGVDLGEGVGADSSVILCRDDLGILEIIVSDTMDLPQAAQEVERLKKKWIVKDAEITYDVLGIGRAFSNHLKRVGINGPIPYAGNGASRESTFTNIRTESGFKLRTRMDPTWAPDFRYPNRVQPAFSIPNAPWRDRLFEELRAHGYELVGSKTRLTPKKDVTEILGHSPDLADALFQTFAFA